MTVKLGTGKIPDESWEMPWPEDPKGLELRCLIAALRRAADDS